VQVIESAAVAGQNAGQLIAANAGLQKFSFKNIKLALQHFNNGGSCPALPESGSANGGCKTINPNPNQAACTPYSASSHFSIIKDAKAGNVPKEEVAKRLLNFVPYDKIMGAYDAA